MTTIKTSANTLCHCGSGLKYKKCHGMKTDTNIDISTQPVIKSLQIKNFRCFENISFKNFSRALFLSIGAENLNLLIKLSHMRGIQSLQGEAAAIMDLIWSPLFNQLNIDNNICIKTNISALGNQKINISLKPAKSQTLSSRSNFDKGPSFVADLTSKHVLEQKFTDYKGQTSTYTMKFTDNGIKIEPIPSETPFPVFFLSSGSSPAEEEVAALYGKLKKNKRVKELNLVEVLKPVEPRLRHLDILPIAGSSRIFGDIGLSQLLPITLMGDGFSKIIGIIMRIANARNGVVLIDEIENGLHHSILEDFWTSIYSAAKLFNTQIIATTHSYECIKSAFNVFNKTIPSDFLMHRLERSNHQIKIVTYETDVIASSINNDFEVR
jgi:hypothetical protein